jgi:hypothetical protein
MRVVCVVRSKFYLPRGLTARRIYMRKNYTRLRQHDVVVVPE